MFFAIVAKEIIGKKLCQKITNKYGKNHKNNKSNKNQDFEKKKPRIILVTFAIFAIFADISWPSLASSFSKSRILVDLLFLRYFSWVFVASKKNPCYICDFCDICGHFGALLWLLFFLSLDSC